MIVFVKPPIRAGQSGLAGEPTPAEHPALGDVLELLHRRFGRLGNVETLSIDVPSTSEPPTATESPSSPTQRESLLTIGDLTIDRRRREVEVAGRLCPLTKSEFDLLVVLAEQPGVVFSRREIVLAYKGSDYPVDDRSIDVQMVNLRRKLGPGRRYLQTIRGVGYRFHAAETPLSRGAR
ncbi:MAG: winged helix-turn-helix transcriptional regulator [Planctomycetales bacterium]|nr:winged helix-turn-helix transcriptional regulator [Planctomycetales bacterium]MBN8624041.1 winged helix-turn-helix transcriptional regulator [Planctomycetota bacterium]